MRGEERGERREGRGERREERGERREGRGRGGGKGEIAGKQESGKAGKLETGKRENGQTGKRETGKPKKREKREKRDIAGRNAHRANIFFSFQSLKVMKRMLFLQNYQCTILKQLAAVQIVVNEELLRSYSSIAGDGSSAGDSNNIWRLFLQADARQDK
jgi:hypothetical protein